MPKDSKFLLMAGALLIMATGMIHLIEAEEAFQEAAYKGWLFCFNGIGAAVAAYGIYFAKKSFGWNLGLAVAAGSLIGYVLSRTVGLPGLAAEPDAWLEPLGVASLITESLFIAAFAKARGFSLKRKQP